VAPDHPLARGDLRGGPIADRGQVVAAGTRDESRGLDALNRAIAAGGIQRIDGMPQTDSLREALVTRDRKLAYRIDDGIPVLLVEEGIALGQVPDFPGA